MIGAGQVLADEITDPLNYMGPLGVGLGLSMNPTGGTYYDEDGNCHSDTVDGCPQDNPSNNCGDTTLYGRITHDEYR